LSDAYQLFPWSWAVDYFSNLGDLISITNNAVASLAGPCAISIVRDTTYTSGHIYVYQGRGSVSPFTSRTRSWQRTAVYPDLAFQMPVLVPGQVLTLVSLAQQYL